MERMSADSTVSTNLTKWKSSSLSILTRAMKYWRRWSDMWRRCSNPSTCLIVFFGYAAGIWDLTSQAMTYDFEVYSAAQDKWLEVSSVSNFEAFQTNRMKIRFKDAAGKTQLVHSLTGSSLALPRIVACLLENHQKKKILSRFHRPCTTISVLTKSGKTRITEAFSSFNFLRTSFLTLIGDGK